MFRSPPRSSIGSTVEPGCKPTHLGAVPVLFVHTSISWVARGQVGCAHTSGGSGLCAPRPPGSQGHEHVIYFFLIYLFI